MKSIPSTLALAAAMAPLAHAATSFGFDSATPAATSGTPLATAVVLQNAYWETQDENGDPLAVPGFRADPVSPAVVVGDPAASGYGAAISGNALNALDGPVMFTFASALNLGSFGVQLDNSTFGNIPVTGGNPAFGTNILFYDAADTLIGYLAVDQTVAGFTVADNGTFNNVSKIILPSGAFYDNVTFSATAVPEPSCLLLGFTGMLGLAARRRRH